jgi:gamma-glutamyl-gamma-aminobutyrate hydrolase PuuD
LPTRDREHDHEQNEAEGREEPPRVEARAPDGLVEAFRVPSAPTFALAVQWHPEWQVMANEFSKSLFAEFGRAARHKNS